jgi:type IV pilus assembly protein PilO
MALNSEYIVKMPIGQKLLILAALITVIGLLYYFLIDSELTKTYKGLQDKFQEKRTDLAKLETVERDKEKLDRELKEKERNLEKAKEKLPTDTEMERLLLNISEIGQQNGITFRTFKPQPEKKQKDGLYIEVPVDLNFSGNFKYVMNFFYKVTSLQRIVNFTGVSMVSSKGTDINVTSKAVTFKFAATK